jgi:hypothetical protein
MHPFPSAKDGLEYFVRGSCVPPLYLLCLPHDLKSCRGPYFLLFALGPNPLFALGGGFMIVQFKFSFTVYRAFKLLHKTSRTEYEA